MEGAHTSGAEVDAKSVKAVICSEDIVPFFIKQFGYCQTSVTSSSTTSMRVLDLVRIE
jgi:hypothetical protein